MAEPVRQSSDYPSPSRPTTHDRTASMSLGTNNAPAAGAAAASENGGHPPPNGGPSDGAAAAAAGAGANVSKQVQEVLESDIGVSTMLNRLKQSIASAKEFALFLKKRSILEDEHAKGMKKLCRMTQENAHLPDHRQGSFGHSYEEMLHIHDRMADNGMQFALSLHQMHEDLLEVAAVAEKHRKGWKQNGLAAEQRLADLESAMRKSKTKYDSLADEYDRVRTGDTSGRKGFGFKGPKSAAQQEEDLLRKVQAADTDYHGKVDTYQAEKRNVVATTRPEAIKALQDLIRECDSGTTLQMQKFASFNEKLLLSNGLVISPLKNHNVEHAQHPRSMKEVIHSIDNKKDLDDYLTSHYSKVPSKSSEPKYERNPVLNPHPNPISQAAPKPQPQSQPQPQPSFQPPVQAPGSLNSRTGPYGDSSQPGAPPQGPPPSFNQGPPTMSGAQGPPSSHGHERSISHGGMFTQPGGMPQQQSPQNYRNSTQPSSHSSRFHGGSASISSAAPPQLGALPFQSQSQPRPSSPPRQGPESLGNPLQQNPPGNHAGQIRSTPPPSANPAGPTKPMFGISLQRLYERDGLAVPMVVYQCIQAVDLFGLNVEGIYRLSGSQNHITKLKGMFDADPDNRNLDFRNPENFFHDVNSVAGLLKQFFRDLPDPLFTAEHYQSFVEAAKNDDEIVRRDSLHAIINSLPDPNYATLRALTLHLHRVMEAASQNRMNSQNLAIVFSPTLLGNAPGGSLGDAGWQLKVVDTILQNTYQIFDED